MRGRSRSRRYRVVRAVLYGMAAAHVIEGLVLRYRRDRLQVLQGPQTESADQRSGADDEVVGQVDVVAATGTTVDAVTLAAAAREMARSGAEVVDLVPADLPAARALRLLRRLDPDQFSKDVFYSPGGAHEAVVRHRSLVERMAGRPDRATLLQPEQAPAELARSTMLAQRYAGGKSVVRVAPGLQAGSRTAADHWSETEALTEYARPYVHLPSGYLVAETTHLLAMTAGLLVAPAAAGAALVTWSAQPGLVFGGRRNGAGLQPPGLVRASLGRLASAWGDNLRTVVVGFRATRRDVVERMSAPIHRTPPTEELFEARRSTCPWCGSEALTGLLDSPDVVVRKPGAFHLDECTGCGHIFQNPALSDRGLDHYYDQTYDGFGEEAATVAFGAQGDVYRRRMDAVARVTEPRAWLDVGTGYGHFCLAARQRWPGRIFDGLDMGVSIEEAARRGWVDTAYRGSFPELADGLPRSYDVVSMHHYLEHTREPRRELAAAAKVLEPGGHLMIEVPDPACPWSRRLGPYWVGWFQPEHLNFVSCENLQEALRQGGFDVLSVERGSATMGGDLVAATLFRTIELAPSPHRPWSSPPAASHVVRRATVLSAAVPSLLTTLMVDKVKDAWIRRERDGRVGNAYRIVARRR